MTIEGVRGYVFTDPNGAKIVIHAFSLYDAKNYFRILYGVYPTKGINYDDQAE